MTDPENPADDMPTQVEAELVPEDGQFQALEGGDIRCLSCHHTFPAITQRTDEAARLEGASDPDDMVMVVPLVCPYCSAEGTLTLGYGPVADGADSDVLRLLS